MLLGPTPVVERVIDDHALREHRVIVGEIDLESLRDGKQPRRLRCQIGTPRIGTAYDQGEAIECRIGDLVDADEGIEAAELAVVTELDIRNVVWRRAGVLGRL